MKKSLLSLLLTIVVVMAQAQTALQPGDLFFTAFQLGVTPSGPDRFAFVALKNLEPGTQVLFTDKAVLNTNPQTLCTNEDTCLWTSPNVIINAGTVITITEEVGGENAEANIGTCVGNMGSLSSSGDQVLAVQRGQGGSLTFISAISNTGFVVNCAPGCTNNNSTCLPTQLVDTPYSMLFSISPVIINGFYSGPTVFDSVSAFYTSLRNQNNWTVSRQADASVTWPSPWTFSIGTVSVKEKFVIGHLQVYPNPSSGAVSVKPGNHQYGKIRVLNILGVLIEERSFQGENIYFNNLKPGIYMVQLLNEKNQPTRAVKLVVK